MQAIGAIAGEPDFSSLQFKIGTGVILYGSFLTAVTNFLIVALALFLLLKGINRLLRPKGAPEEVPDIRQCPHCKLNIPITATKCQGCTSDLEPAAA
jgi:large conductance mechanosensitive channel